MRQIVACIESETYALPSGPNAMSLGSGGSGSGFGEQGGLTIGGRQGLRSGKGGEYCSCTPVLGSSRSVPSCVLRKYSLPPASKAIEEPPCSASRFSPFVSKRPVWAPVARSNATTADGPAPVVPSVAAPAA